MKRIAWLLLLAPSLLAAQNPSDTGSATRHAEGPQRRDAWIRKELGLTEDQAAKLDATEMRFAGQRRDLMKRQRAIFEAYHPLWKSARRHDRCADGDLPQRAADRPASAPGEPRAGGIGADHSPPLDCSRRECRRGRTACSASSHDHEAGHAHGGGAGAARHE